MTLVRPVTHLLWLLRIREERLVRSVAAGLVAALALTTLLAATADIAAERSASGDRTVAVTADAEDVVPRDDLATEVVDDPSTAVADGDADLGVLSTVDGLRVFQDPADEESVDALARFRIAVSAGDPATSGAEVEHVPVEALTARQRATTTRSVLFGLAIAVQAAVMGAAALRQSGSRLLEPLVVLPAPRRDLAAAFTAGHVPLVGLHLGVLTAALVVVAALPAPGLGLPLGALPEVAVGMAGATLGLAVVGAGAAALLTIGMPQRRNSAVAIAVVAVVMLPAFVAAQHPVTQPAAFGWLPVLSSFGIAADGLGGNLVGAELLRSLAVSVGAGIALARVTAGRIDREALVTR